MKRKVDTKASKGWKLSCGGGGGRCVGRGLGEGEEGCGGGGARDVGEGELGVWGREKGAHMWGGGGGADFTPRGKVLY